MVIRKFLLVLRSENGFVSTSDLLYHGVELTDGVIHFHDSGFRVIDVIPVDIDFSKYEH